jgi:AcrR family transcriptional regulator
MAPRSKLPYKPRLKRDERRALIEEAASELFAERGYDGTTLEAIAVAAGISKAVLYDHFESQAALQISLLDQNSRALLEFTAERVAAVEGARERFLAGAEAFFEFVETHPFAWRMIFRDPPSDPAVAAAYAARSHEVTLAIAAMFRAEAEVAGLVEEGEEEQLEMLAVQVKNAMAGLASWWYEHRERNAEEMVKALMNLAWLGADRIIAGERYSQ